MGSIPFYHKSTSRIRTCLIINNYLQVLHRGPHEVEGAAGPDVLFARRAGQVEDVLQPPGLCCVHQRVVALVLRVVQRERQRDRARQQVQGGECAVKVARVVDVIVEPLQDCRDALRQTILRNKFTARRVKSGDPVDLQSS
eukprot:7355420-Pyramimonas_sp.AAC.1